MTGIVLLLGLAVGLLVGLRSIGGGVVLVPALAYLLHMDQHMAQGTSLLILLPPVGGGALREYWKQGQVDLRRVVGQAAGAAAYAAGFRRPDADVGSVAGGERLVALGVSEDHG